MIGHLQNRWFAYQSLKRAFGARRARQLIVRDELALLRYLGFGWFRPTLWFLQAKLWLDGALERSFPRSVLLAHWQIWRKRREWDKVVARWRGAPTAYEPGELDGDEWADFMSGISDGAIATNPQTGQKIVFHNGQWADASTGQPAPISQ